MATYSQVLLTYANIIKLHPGISLDRLHDPRRRFVFSIDIAEGLGDDYDYTVCTIFEILPMLPEEIQHLKVVQDEYSFFKLVQIGLIRSNEIESSVFAQVVYHVLTEMFIPDNVRIVIENNYDGNYFRKTLTTIYGEDNNELDEDELFCQFPYNLKDDQSYATRIGLVQTEKSKKAGTKLLKEQLSQNQTVLLEYITCEEAISFARKKNRNGVYSNYSAMTGHDDCIMTCVNVAHIRTLPEFQELVDGVSASCPPDFWKLVAEKLNKQDFTQEDSGDITDLFGASDDK